MRAGLAHCAVLNACLILTSCVSVEPPAARQDLGVQHVSQKSYTLGATAEARIGDDVVKVEDYSVSQTALDEVEVTSDFAIEHPAYSHSFRKGEVFPLAGSVDFDGQSYDVMKVGHIGIVFGSDGTVYRKIVNNLERTNRRIPAIPVTMVWDFQAQPPGPHLKRKVNRKIEATAKNFELIFAGLTADAIRVTYREFAPDNSSAAGFAQELSYPIGSKQMRFRNLAIEVIEAKPDRLTYKVVTE
ncbi:MAG: hypothetical protein JO261_04090 [Alphaproteobacteria bacterium]|nr:hypothetical protein [Alphaproteobacteria bacterium]MBV9692861.1 hypothetical protein [Alphaproteobacteria bacterium]